MTMETVSFVVPVIRSRKGRLEPGQPTAFKRSEDARRKAERISQHQPGAVTYTRSGDPDFNEYGEPIITGTFGDVPQHVLTTIAPPTW